MSGASGPASSYGNALAAHDLGALRGCVSPGIRFTDPDAGELTGFEAVARHVAMWFSALSGGPKLTSVKTIAPGRCTVALDIPGGGVVIDEVWIELTEDGDCAVTEVRRRVANGPDDVETLQKEAEAIEEELRLETHRSMAQLKCSNALLKRIKSSEPLETPHNEHLNPGTDVAEQGTAALSTHTVPKETTRWTMLPPDEGATLRKDLAELQGQLQGLREAQGTKESLWRNLMKKKDQQLTVTLKREKAHVTKLREKIALLLQELENVRKGFRSAVELTEQQHKDRMQELLHRLGQDKRIETLQRQQRDLIQEFLREITVQVEMRQGEATARASQITAEMFKRASTIAEMNVAPPVDLPLGEEEAMLRERVMQLEALEIEYQGRLAGAEARTASARKELERASGDNNALRQKVAELEALLKSAAAMEVSVRVPETPAAPEVPAAKATPPGKKLEDSLPSLSAPPVMRGRKETTKGRKRKGTNASDVSDVSERGAPQPTKRWRRAIVFARGVARFWLSLPAELSDGNGGESRASRSRRQSRVSTVYDRQGTHMSSAEFSPEASTASACVKERCEIAMQTDDAAFQLYMKELRDKAREEKRKAMKRRKKAQPIIEEDSDSSSSEEPEEQPAAPPVPRIYKAFCYVCGAGPHDCSSGKAQLCTDCQSMMYFGPRHRRELRLRLKQERAAARRRPPQGQQSTAAGGQQTQAGSEQVRTQPVPQQVMQPDPPPQQHEAPAAFVDSGMYGGGKAPAPPPRTDSDPAQEVQSPRRNVFTPRMRGVGGGRGASAREQTDEKPKVPQMQKVVHTAMFTLDGKVSSRGAPPPPQPIARRSSLNGSSGRTGHFGRAVPVVRKEQRPKVPPKAVDPHQPQEPAPPSLQELFAEAALQAGVSLPPLQPGPPSTAPIGRRTSGGGRKTSGPQLPTQVNLGASSPRHR